MPHWTARKQPPVGAIFEGHYKGKKYTVEVINKEGDICYRLGKKVFSSPSAAAKSIVKCEVNGWLFWRMDK
jgi:hypothetical protein